jgi:hypothetical protein
MTFIVNDGQQNGNHYNSGRVANATVFFEFQKNPARSHTQSHPFYSQIDKIPQEDEASEDSSENNDLPDSPGASSNVIAALAADLS